MVKKKEEMNMWCCKNGHKGMWCCKGMMLLILVGVLLISWVAIKLIWDWIVPDLFPTGILAATVSWTTAFKLAVLTTICVLIKKMKKKMHYKKMQYLMKK